MPGRQTAQSNSKQCMTRIRWKPVDKTRSSLSSSRELGFVRTGRFEHLGTHPDRVCVIRQKADDAAHIARVPSRSFAQTKALQVAARWEGEDPLVKEMIILLEESVLWSVARWVFVLPEAAPRWECQCLRLNVLADNSAVAWGLLFAINCPGSPRIRLFGCTALAGRDKR